MKNKEIKQNFTMEKLNKKDFEYTTIKFSSVHKYNTKGIINLIGKKLKTCVDFKEYNAYYNNQFEFGTELTFFETLNENDLMDIWKILKEKVSGFGCYFLDNKNVSGCSNSLLFNNGCDVGLYIKNKEYKDEIERVN